MNQAAKPLRSSRPPQEKSLLARALSYLSRREHSRLELQRKLAAHAESPEDVEKLLDQLQEKNLLSDQRFADSLARRRGERFGTVRIKQELKMHGLNDELTRSTVARLEQTEFQRALDVWSRKFGVRTADAKERARQARFLSQRGFSSEVVIRVLKSSSADPIED